MVINHNIYLPLHKKFRRFFMTALIQNKNVIQEVRNGQTLMGVINSKSISLTIKQGETYTTIYFNKSGSIKKLNCG